MFIEFLGKNISEIKILDIGARVIKNDPPIYTSIIDHYNSHVTAVEADASACKSISQSEKGSVQ
ncbi:hypothetical protein ACRRVC_01040 [Candidatus Cardinium hertigii]